MQNTQLVLLTIVILTLATFTVILTLSSQSKDVPPLVVNLGTTLLGILTGSVVTLSAKPSIAAQAPQLASEALATNVVGTLVGTAPPTTPSPPAGDGNPPEGDYIHPDVAVAAAGTVGDVVTGENPPEGDYVPPPVQ